MPAPISPDDLDHVLDHTRDVWESARGARVFLTGGTGFFGVWLAETFAHANQRLGLDAELMLLSRDPGSALSRVPRFGQLRGVSFHRGDVRHFVFPQGGFTHVINAAAESSHQQHAGDHRHMFDTIVDGTRRTLDLARHAHAAHYLVVSSGAVYGQQPVDLALIPEDFPGSPPLSAAASAYGEGKRAAEVLAAIEADRGNLSVRVARCFAFVGPHLPLDAHFAIGNFIRDALRGAPIQVAGDGTAVRSYLYAADLAIWLWTLALSPHAAGAYNVGSEKAVSIVDLARTVAASSRPDLVVRVAGTAGAGTQANRYVPSTARARKLLRLGELVELDDAIRRTIRWYSAP